MHAMQELIDFSIVTWYELFKDITLKTYIINVPQDVIRQFILKDYQTDSPSLAELAMCKPTIDKLKETLAILNNRAFVRSNWHSAIDASHFSLCQELLVTNVDDIFFYFSNSPTILNDYACKYELPFVIALRPWIVIHPATEFRCIVINNILRGITLRCWPAYYSHLKDEGPDIIKVLKSFFVKKIKGKFPRVNFIFDVILFHKIDDPVIVDFGPLNNKTELCSFKWDEIEPLIKEHEVIEDIAPVFRYLENDVGIFVRENRSWALQ